MKYVNVSKCLGYYFKSTIAYGVHLLFIRLSQFLSKGHGTLSAVTKCCKAFIGNCFHDICSDRSR
jgi:hypothetical protein